MTAKEMFEEMGYEYNYNLSEIIFPNHIIYEKNLDSNNSLSRRYIAFDLKNKSISTEDYLFNRENNKYVFYEKQPKKENEDYIYIPKYQEKAIQKQIEELGW
jgi:hypothetical protein